MTHSGILFVIGSLDTGGTELNAVRTAIQLRKRGVDVQVVCISKSGPLARMYESAGIPLHFITTGSLWKPRAWFAIARLRRLIQSMQPAVVHAHDIYSNVVAYLSHPKSTETRLFTSQRFVIFPSNVWKFLNHFVYRQSTRVTVNSPALKRIVVEHASVLAKNVVVIPNHIDEKSLDTELSPALSDVKTTLAAAAPSLVFTCLARLSPVKNHQLLLRAFAATGPSARKWILVIVGDGPELPALQRLASELRIDSNVFFAGALPATPSPHLLGDVAALSSIGEGFPNSLLEAMAVGKPVVATNVGGVGDVVAHEVTGLLVESGDLDGFTGALIRIGSDHSLRSKLGQAALSVVHKEHRADSVLGLLVQSYRSD